MVPGSDIAEAKVMKSHPWIQTVKSAVAAVGRGGSGVRVGGAGVALARAVAEAVTVGVTSGSAKSWTLGAEGVPRQALSVSRTDSKAARSQ